LSSSLKHFVRKEEIFMSTAELKYASEPAPSLQPLPSPEKFFETMHAYQRTAALKAAIELDLFTAVGEGLRTVPELAKRASSSERGIRALCDYMAILGFLTKTEGRYGLTADSAVFLDKKSPAYVGSATQFMASPAVMDGFRDLTAVVRSGRPLSDEAFTKDEHPAWVDFARSMAPVLHIVTQETEKLVHTESPVKVLDVAAGHGMFGITVAQHNSKAKIVALDWPSVLTVAKDYARRSGVSDRYTLLPGNAFEVSLGTGFDVVLVPNFLHHWDRVTIETFLRKVHAAMSPAGRLVVVEFAPNDDRISPPAAAAFVMNMLALTPGGDAYTSSEYREMLLDSGFSGCEVHPLPPTPHTAIIATKK
jgi:ubiquinone/menaquinone biosynthesis C-methylase UbiE